ncbi:hypothetical protein PQX77_009437 [Marasmius sp. AFHP31]|nr:hypothetical protein PQX77_009437 [Marasmius sp. AFHP31]
MYIPAPQTPRNRTEFEQGLQLLQAILEDGSKRESLVQMTGEDAQEWLDLLQLLAEYPNVPKTLRSSLFNVMIRLSRNSGLHPRCLTIQNVEKLGEHPEGGGAFGDVWKGKIGGSSLVCIKVIRAFSVTDVEKMLKDYIQEAIVWRQLNHRNLLPFMGIFYLDNDRKRLCLVSPWMEQGNLVQFLKNTSSEMIDHELLVEDVACGLAYLHEMKIIHGDLKGANILITPELRASIGDFGLSRVSDTQRLFSQSSRSKGTIRWLSPELLKPGPNSVPSRESDVYAYGCVCYEIFAGHVPFPGLSEAAVLFIVVLESEHPTRPKDSPKLHDLMWDLMVECWIASPLDRPTMAQVMDQLRGMNLQRNLETATEWSDPQYTRVWGDIDEEQPVVKEENASPTLRLAAAIAVNPFLTPPSIDPRHLLLPEPDSPAFFQLRSPLETSTEKQRE